MALHLLIGRLKAHSGLEPVPISTPVPARQLAYDLGASLNFNMLFSVIAETTSKSLRCAP